MGLAGRAIGAALDESVDPVKGGMLALPVIEAAEPSDSATLMLSTEEAIQDVSLAELLAFAAAHGSNRPLPKPSQRPPRGHSGATVFAPEMTPLRRAIISGVATPVIVTRVPPSTSASAIVSDSVFLTRRASKPSSITSAPTIATMIAHVGRYFRVRTSEFEPAVFIV
jgi:hypothetical protein